MFDVAWKVHWNFHERSSVCIRFSQTKIEQKPPRSTRASSSSDNNRKETWHTKEKTAVLKGSQGEGDAERREKFPSSSSSDDVFTNWNSRSETFLCLLPSVLWGFRKCKATVLVRLSMSLFVFINFSVYIVEAELKLRLDNTPKHQSVVEVKINFKIRIVWQSTWMLLNRQCLVNVTHATEIDLKPIIYHWAERMTLESRFPRFKC